MVTYVITYYGSCSLASLRNVYLQQRAEILFGTRSWVRKVAMICYAHWEHFCDVISGSSEDGKVGWNVETYVQLTHELDHRVTAFFIR